jgi:hypothetical protein
VYDEDEGSEYEDESDNEDLEKDKEGEHHAAAPARQLLFMDKSDEQVCCGSFTHCRHWVSAPAISHVNGLTCVCLLSSDCVCPVHVPRRGTFA